MRFASVCALVSIGLLAGCSSPQARQTKIFAAGEKATADNLVYSVVDSEIQTRLGEDPNPRIPQTRFIIVELAVTSSANVDVPIPGVALIDDSGRSYPELADGAGVPHWLGIVRHVGPGQTERGSVVFDAPAGHYKLKLTDEMSANDVYIDIPLSFVHEQMNDVNSSVASPVPDGAGAIKPKK